MNKNQLLRSIPKVDDILSYSYIVESLKTVNKAVVLSALRDEIDNYRQQILSSDQEIKSLERNPEDWKISFLDAIERKNAPSLKKVINGTGVILHTNLGRSLISKKVLEEFYDYGSVYNNLEYNIENGTRGSRYDHVVSLICELTGAEDALIVNNNAAAVMLVLQTISSGGNALVSRGELVEIGGSFRIPEIMKLSGTKLYEVGTTNKTHLSDYENAIDEETKLIMKVHQSNFEIVGFTESVNHEDLKTLAKQYDLPLYEDLGSGVLIDLEKYGLRHEPTVIESIKSDVDIISFSGDKLLGGPQAGILIGKKKYIDQMKSNQLLRALRVDKITIYLLEETLKLYYDENLAIQEIPTLSMMTLDKKELRSRAENFIKEIQKSLPSIKISLLDGYSQVGGGSMPTEEIETVLLNIKIPFLSTHELEKKLRLSKSHIIGRIQENQYLLDTRTLQKSDYPLIRQELENIIDQVK